MDKFNGRWDDVTMVAQVMIGFHASAVLHFITPANQMMIIMMSNKIFGE